MKKKPTKLALNLYFTPTVKEELIKRLSEKKDNTSHIVEVLDETGYHVWIDGIAFIKAGAMVGKDTEIIYMERLDKK